MDARESHESSLEDLSVDYPRLYSSSLVHLLLMSQTKEKIGQRGKNVQLDRLDAAVAKSLVQPLFSWGQLEPGWDRAEAAGEPECHFTFRNPLKGPPSALHDLLMTCDLTRGQGYQSATSCKIREDWKYVAMVIDRLQLYIFFIVTTAGTIGILMDAPHIFEYVDQDRIIEIYRGK
ncbi:hypothetical protein J437_LFUL017653 [Ladona fulva]|uniref:Neurotransmitter-gated ion-channel transmembrane domain-containing protein n=1 Tax=Ladona fulva TaxID=123851 RepID=A0A8K0P9D6_LADFU|nr:hypothetical protein J437_LFUL017653 [Ladona fulva]